MFLKRIKELRKEKGITQGELGTILGFGDSTISQYESGKRTPDHETLQKLADYFNVSTDYLLGRSDSKWPTNAAEFIKEGYTPYDVGIKKISDNLYKLDFGDFMTKEDLILIQEIKQLPNEQRVVVELLVKQLLEKMNNEKNK